MHEDTPTRISTIASVGGALTNEIATAVAASAPFLATAGAATAQLRSEAQLGNLFEDDETLAQQFNSVMRLIAMFERIANESAGANQRLIELSRQFAETWAAMQARLAELEAEP